MGYKKNVSLTISKFYDAFTTEFTTIYYFYFICYCTELFETLNNAELILSETLEICIALKFLLK